MTQLPKLFGVKGGGENFFERVGILFGQIGDTNVVVFGFGVTLLLLLLGDRIFPGRPVALFLVALSIIAVTLFSLTQYGMTVVGELPRGLPDIGPPSLRLKDIDGVIPLAFACFLLAYIEGVSAARVIANKHQQAIDVRQELLGLGAANLAVAFAHGYPVAGGLSQSAVNDNAGAKTPLALVFASVTLALVLLFLTGLLRNLPNVLLAVIVLVAVKGLINIQALRHLWKVSRPEFYISMVALLSVLVLGILQGVMLAAVFSILMLLARASRPHVAFLGRIPGTDRFSDLERHPENEIIPGMLIFRVESSLFYFNEEYVLKSVLEKVGSEPNSIQSVVCDLSTSPRVDLAGARMLIALYDQLSRKNIALRLADARSAVRDILRAEKLEERVGPMDRQSSLHDVIESIPKLQTVSERGKSI